MLSDWLTSVIKGQESSGFCFSHLSHLVQEYNHLCSCYESFHDQGKGIKKCIQGLRNSFPSTVIRSLLEQMEEVKEKKSFWVSSYFWTGKQI